MNKEPMTEERYGDVLDAVARFRTQGTRSTARQFSLDCFEAGRIFEHRRAGAELDDLRVRVAAYERAINEARASLGGDA